MILGDGSAETWIHVCINYDFPQQIELSVFMPKNRWFGMTLGDDGMAAGSDMLVFNSEKMTFTDKHSAGYMYPSTDESQDWELTQFLENDERVRFDVMRELDTEDENDFVF